MESVAPTFLQTAAWDEALESLKSSTLVTDFTSLKADSSVIKFKLNNNQVVTEYVIYKQWCFDKDMVRTSGIAILIDCLGTLNQRPNHKGRLNNIVVSVFGYGKIQTWSKLTLLL